MSIYARDFVDSSRGTRIPSSVYQGKNGFFPLRIDGTDKTNDTALARHRTAMYILTQKDRPIPSIEEMKKELCEPETSAKFKERIATRNAQHLNDLERMYTWHAQEYLEEALDQYLSWDEAMSRTDGENNPAILESSQKLESLYSTCRRAYPDVLKWEDDLAMLNYTHHRHLSLLHQRRRDLEAAEEDERKRREAEFPKTVEEFWTKKKEAQYRAAALLTIPESDAAAQERLLNESGWTWRQIQPLMQIFKKDKVFNAEIVGLCIEKKMEASVRDPRRAR